ncbi:hypothetical protein VN97_g3801 [Penicillium thymicola]|uniref:Uncharacterized protein n=1 Tax=Penicillium thymicola TaxID=293382 RepID=A0AAI9TML5_PENTH|nr:hypothetical protein VN97_g3801 [Penicillium thymicola]
MRRLHQLSVAVGTAGEIMYTITSSFGPYNHRQGFVYIATLLVRAQNPSNSQLQKRKKWRYLCICMRSKASFLTLANRPKRWRYVHLYAAEKLHFCERQRNQATLIIKAYVIVIQVSS